LFAYCDGARANDGAQTSNAQMTVRANDCAQTTARKRLARKWLDTQFNGSEKVRFEMA